jgi:HSP20 family molecular chaperone IbpA
MKRRGPIKLSNRLLAMGASIAMVSTAAAAAEDTQRDSGGFVENIKNFQEKISETFRDSWRALWQDKNTKNISESTLSTASLDLREQQDSYTLRLNLPNRDMNKVEINLSGDTLHIVAPAEGTAGRYEQDIQLDGVAANGALKLSAKRKTILSS